MIRKYLWKKERAKNRNNLFDNNKELLDKKSEYGRKNVKKIYE